MNDAAVSPRSEHANIDCLERLIRLREVIATTGQSRSEIYRREARGEFSKRIPLSGRITVWRMSEIQQFVRARVDGRENGVRERAKVGQFLTQARAAVEQDLGDEIQQSAANR